MEISIAMKGVVALTLHSLRKLLLSRKLLITILVAVFVAVVMGYAGSQDVDPLQDGTDLMDTLILFFFMPVMAMIFGTSLIRDDIDDKSITHVVTAPLDRAWSYIGYYLPLVAAVVVSMVIIDTAGFLAFFLQQGMSNEMLGLYVEFIALVTIGSFVYSALFLAVSVVFRKPVFIGLFYAFIWEGFIGSLPGAIQKASIKHYLRSLGSEWIDHGQISNFADASSVGDSVIVLCVVPIVFLILGTVWFRREEIS
jgi:ABC-2 type transport system permease protein